MSAGNDFMKAASDLKRPGHVVGEAVFEKAEHVEQRALAGSVGADKHGERRDIAYFDILKYLEVVQGNGFNLHTWLSYSDLTSVPGEI